MQRMVLEPGVRPTLVARPEEVFDSRKPDNEVSDVQNRQGSAKTATAFERLSSAEDDAARPRPWNAAEALLQLKLALEDIPQLCPLPADARLGTSSPKILEGSSGLDRQKVASLCESSPVLPSLVRYNSSTGPASAPSYAQASLCHIEAACRQLEEKLESLEMPTSNAAVDLPWAHVMACLKESEVVTQLLQRAEAAVWERENAYRIHELLVAELRRRGVPVAIANEDFAPFLDAVEEARRLLEGYVHAQRSLDSTAPMLEAAVARATCVEDIAALASPASIAALDTLQGNIATLSNQVKADERRVRQNTEAMKRRLDALRNPTAAQ